jgi:hypothetical protein
MELQKLRTMKETRALRKRSIFVLGEVSRWLKKDFGRSFNFNLREIDQVRLYNLWIWSERYSVSIRYILKVLVPYWSNRFKRRGGQAWGLGVKMHTFVGKHSVKLLEEQIEKDFPNRENVELAKHNRRMALLGLDTHEPVKSRDVLECESIEDYVRKYKKRVNVSRRTLDYAEGQTSRRLRPYRGNPWL